MPCSDGGPWEDPRTVRDLSEMRKQNGILTAQNDRLREDATQRYSDLYLITKSNIPFEADEIRYGGDHREISDERWIEFAETWSLPYVILQASDPKERLEEATAYCMSLFNSKAAGLNYQREGKEYAHV